MSSCDISTRPGALPTDIELRVRRREASRLLTDSRSYTTTIRPAQHLRAAHGEQPGITGARADEVHGHQRSAQEPTRAPRVRRHASSRCVATTRSTGGVGIGTALAVAQHDAAVERREQTFDVQHAGSASSTCASAPAGRSQSPPSSARKARSASTARRLGSCSMAASDRRVSSSSSSRHSTASAPWPDLRNHHVGRRATRR